MTQQRPEDRPTALLALQQWKTIRAKTFWMHRAWRLHLLESVAALEIVFDAFWLLQLGICLTRRFFSKIIAF